MRLTLHWRGRPLLAVDLVATSPEDDPGGPTLEAAGNLQASDLAEPMEPDTRVIGFGARPES
jgi:hypothetical protein